MGETLQRLHKLCPKILAGDKHCTLIANYDHKYKIKQGVDTRYLIVVSKPKPVSHSAINLSLSLYSWGFRNILVMLQ